MIVDSSAVVAILRAEPDAPVYSQAIEQARRKLMAAPTFLETAMVVIGRKGEAAGAGIERFLLRSGIEIVPFTPAAARVAAAAFVRYGKGRHPAGLNFGDCISYALAKTELMPLLFKGDDFRLTDIELVA
jgi:ribonuclease VapC